MKRKSNKTIDPEQSENKDFRSKKFILILNNPKESGLDHAKINETLASATKTYSYSIMGDEIGDQGTYHTHVFACFTQVVRFSTLRKHFPSAHIEVAKGSVEQNVNYIKKECTPKNLAKAHTKVPNTIDVFGTKPIEHQGKSSLQTTMYHLVVKEGLSDMEVVRRCHGLAFHLDKVARLRETYLYEKYSKKIRYDLRVTYIFGETGTGKTSSLFEEFGAENICRITDYKHPFDQYSAQPILVLDEYRSQFDISTILNLLDIYPLVLPARYNNKIACQNTIFIVSNLPLEEQYVEIQKTQKGDWDAFLRRIHSVGEYIGNRLVIKHGTAKEYMENLRNFLPCPPHKTPFYSSFPQKIS